MGAQDDLPRPSPVELIEGALARVADVEHPADPPGNEWNFALGVLFALGSTRQLDEETIRAYEERMESEARRLRGEG